jgi:RNA polymerase-interacting CarD/CdnL/TRCF family regulator
VGGDTVVCISHDLARLKQERAERSRERQYQRQGNERLEQHIALTASITLNAR